MYMYMYLNMLNVGISNDGISLVKWRRKVLPSEKKNGVFVKTFAGKSYACIFLGIG